MITITGKLENSSGQSLHQWIEFTSQSTPQFGGAVVQTHTLKKIKSDPATGEFSVGLAAGNYSVSVKSSPRTTPFTIAVPEGNDTIAIEDLVTTEVATLPGVAPYTIWNGTRAGHITFNPIADPAQLALPTLVTFSGGHIQSSTAYSYKVSYITADGETALSPVRTITAGAGVTGKALRVVLEVSPTRVISKRLWRTATDGNFHLLASLAPEVPYYDDWESMSDFSGRGTTSAVPTFNTTAGIIYSSSGVPQLYFSSTGLRVLTTMQTDLLVNMKGGLKVGGTAFARSFDGTLTVAEIAPAFDADVGGLNIMVPFGITKPGLRVASWEDNSEFMTVGVQSTLGGDYGIKTTGLHCDGQIRIGSSSTAGYVLTATSAGYGTWQASFGATDVRSTPLTGLTSLSGSITAADTILQAFGRTASKSYVDTAIANLVASSPAALDTLNELAAALGNDANFATTVTTALAGKVATTRTISTTSPLLGGGDLSANRTLSLAGLTGLGTANQFLGMNSGATAYEYKSFAAGTSGTDFAISHAANLITFNLPTASAANRGLLSMADWSTFNGKQAALGFTAENVANKSTTTSLGTSNTLYPTQNAVKTYVDTKAALYLPLTGGELTGPLAVNVLASLTGDGDIGTNRSRIEFAASNGIVFYTYDYAVIHGSEFSIRIDSGTGNLICHDGTEEWTIGKLDQDGAVTLSGWSGTAKVTCTDGEIDLLAFLTQCSGDFNFRTDNANDIGTSGHLPRTIYAGTSIVSPLFTGNLTGNVTGAASLNVLKTGDALTGLLTSNSQIYSSTTLRTGQYTVAGLPAAATAGSGARAYVTDATATTFQSTVAGGGANKVPVYSDGTNWKIG